MPGGASVLLWAAFARATPIPDLKLKSSQVPVVGIELCYPSGLKLQAVQRSGTGLVSVATIVEGGWAEERTGEGHAAHLIEHLWLDEATPLGEPNRVALSAIEATGWTSPDETGFVSIAATEDLDLLLQLEAARLQDPLVGVTLERFSSTVEVVRSEELWRGGDDQARARTALETALWQGGALAPPPPDRLDALTLEATRAHATRTYVPAGTTIRLEGDIDPTALQARVQQIFPPEALAGQRKSCSHSPEPADPGPPASTELIELPAAVVRPELTFGWSLPPGYGPQDEQASLLAAWLSDALVHEVGISRGVESRDVWLGCSYRPGARASLLLCATPLSHGTRPEDVYARVRTSMKRELQDELRSPTDILEVKVDQFDGALSLADSMDPEVLYDRALFSHYVDGAIDPLGKQAHGTFTATVADLKAFGRAWLTPERMVALAQVPGGGEDARGSDFDGAAVLEPPAARTWTTPRPDLSGWTSATVGQGLTVWNLPRDATAPMTWTGLAFSRGSEVGEPGSATAHAQLFAADTGIPYLELLNSTATVGHFDFDTTGSSRVTAAGPRGNIDAQLYVLRVVVDHTRYIGRTSDDIKLRRKRAFERLDEYPGAFASHWQRQRLFPDAMSPWDHFDAVAQRTRSDAAEWKRAVLRPDAGVLVVSGYTEPAAFGSDVSRFLGSWKNRGEPAPPPAAPAAPAERQLSAFEYPYVLSSVSLMCRLPPRGVEIDAASDAVWFLANQALHQTLRDRGGTYGLDSRLVDHGSLGSTLELEATLPPNASAAAIRGMVGVMDRLAEPTEADIAWARNHLHLDFARNVASSWAAFETGTRAASAGLSLEELRSYPDRVDALDAAAVARVLEQCHGHEALTYVGKPTELGVDGVVWQPWIDEARSIMRR